MTKTSNNSLKHLGIFRTGDAVRAGISQPTLSRLVASRRIVRLEHGIYLHPDAKIEPDEVDLAIACLRFGPDSAISGLTSLFRYGLIEQVPDRIWVVICPNLKSANPLYRCLRSIHNPNIGIEKHEFYQMANIERSVIEAISYGTKIGLQTAISAARRALREDKTSQKKLYEMAKKLDALPVLERYWDSIISE